MKLEEVKPAMYKKKIVEYSGGKYYIEQCILWFDKGEFKHSLKLSEAREDVMSYVTVNIEKVSVLN